MQEIKSKEHDDKNHFKEALKYHIGGKISVVPKTPLRNEHDLSLAYSPGVAAPCKAIEENPLLAFKYTSKSNLVAVISNGSAVLGLGDIGAQASKPVMEGKAVLFKTFGHVDAFDIEVNEKDPRKFIEIVKAIAPTFGGINLEDIKAPDCFLIERELKDALDIPLMHDDQHGTAIVSTAAIMNASDIIGKSIESMRVVIVGAGAAGIACGKMYREIGIKEIVMFDSKGCIDSTRNDLNEYKKEFISTKHYANLREALSGADVFLGLSKPNLLSGEDIKAMASDPLIFALANPVPEILPEIALKARPDAIIATGRSDYPNQINNVLGFPYIFNGALKVHAKKINYEMKIAAARALASLAREDVPLTLQRLHEHKLVFGREYLVPSPFDKRLLEKVANAVAKAAIDSGVARLELDRL